jgi:hypothetical protein
VSPSCYSCQASLTIKTRARAISIREPVVLLVVEIAAVVIAATGLPITAGTSIITSSAASTTRGPLPRIKVIETYKTLSS